MIYGWRSVLCLKISKGRFFRNRGTIRSRSPLYQVKAVMKAVSQRRSSHEKHTAYFYSQFQCYCLRSSDWFACVGTISLSSEQHDYGRGEYSFRVPDGTTDTSRW